MNRDSLVLAAWIGRNTRTGEVSTDAIAEACEVITLAERLVRRCALADMDGKATDEMRAQAERAEARIAKACELFYGTVEFSDDARGCLLTIRLSNGATTLF